jgi:hypothetical protein
MTIIEQTEILNQLAGLVHDSVPLGYDRAWCVFDYDHGYEDGSSSVGTTLWYDLNNVQCSVELVDPEVLTLDLVPKLHTMMKVQTGGDWYKFTLSIDKAGRATTNFDYQTPDD